MAMGAGAGLVVVAALLLVVQTRASRPVVSDSPDPGLRQADETARDSPEVASPPARNVFEYQTEASRVLRDPAPIPMSLAAPPPLTPAPPSPVRLIGLVTRANRLRAALLISGEMAVLGPGEQANGYAVVSIDEDLGVKLRDQQGIELTLPIDSVTGGDRR
jgi:hypothetical protein